MSATNGIRKSIFHVADSMVEYLPLSFFLQTIVLFEYLPEKTMHLSATLVYSFCSKFPSYYCHLMVIKMRAGDPRGLEDQNYFHDNTKTFFTFSTSFSQLNKGVCQRLYHMRYLYCSDPWSNMGLVFFVLKFFNL